MREQGLTLQVDRQNGYGMQPILPVTVHVKKIKSAARQRYGDGDRVVKGEQIFKGPFTPDESEGKGESFIWCLPFILRSFLLVIRFYTFAWCEWA